MSLRYLYTLFTSTFFLLQSISHTNPKNVSKGKRLRTFLTKPGIGICLAWRYVAWWYSPRYFTITSGSDGVLLLISITSNFTCALKSSSALSESHIFTSFVNFITIPSPVETRSLNLYRGAICL